MNAKLISRTLVSSAIASLLLAGAAAQAAPTRAELDEANFVQTLKEAGFTYPSIEEALKVRKEAITRAEADKAAKSIAKGKGEKSTASN